MKKIELNEKTLEVIEGIVKNFHPQKGFGFLTTAIGDVFFHVKNFFQVVEGLSHPRFVSGCPETSPLPGSKLVVLIDDKSEPGRAPNALAWGWQSAFSRAERNISHRPVFRVLALKDRFNGRFVKDSSPVVIEGNLTAIESECPRKIVGDPLSAVGTYQTGPCSRENRWQVRNSDGSWSDTNDPRAWSLEVTQVVFRVSRGMEQLFHGHIGMLSAIQDRYNGPEFIFELRCLDGIWMETSDPRKDLKTAITRFQKMRGVSEKIALPIATPAVASGPQPVRKPADKPGQPKKEVSKPTVLKDLADLKL